MLCYCPLRGPPNCEHVAEAAVPSSIIIFALVVRMDDANANISGETKLRVPLLQQGLVNCMCAQGCLRFLHTHASSAPPDRPRTPPTLSKPLGWEGWVAWGPGRYARFVRYARANRNCAHWNKYDCMGLLRHLKHCILRICAGRSSSNIQGAYRLHARSTPSKINEPMRW